MFCLSPLLANSAMQTSMQTPCGNVGAAGMMQVTAAMPQ
jgi:hypothetical protein